MEAADHYPLRTAFQDTTVLEGQPSVQDLSLSMLSDDFCVTYINGHRSELEEKSFKMENEAVWVSDCTSSLVEPASVCEPGETSPSVVNCPRAFTPNPTGFFCQQSDRVSKDHVGRREIGLSFGLFRRSQAAIRRAAINWYYYCILCTFSSSLGSGSTASELCRRFLIAKQDNVSLRMLEEVQLRDLDPGKAGLGGNLGTVETA
ncbi:hypothetical protein I7I51_00842 [Histoplasma capsulatum]|uniref:Uncharacterized protein n=1 Tax=Ajellomyces capsulatus TaxID=5037 RepID=A0A8A1MGT7_AJECA|nr:hypothetical protein I7I51_00842 [Histoplasma capsulatum]